MDRRSRLEYRRRIVYPRYGTVSVFAVISWGCAATTWLARALSQHPEILCVHGLRSQVLATQGSDAWSPVDYLHELRILGSVGSLVGDVHSLSATDVPDLRREFGELLRSCAVVRDPVQRIGSFMALVRAWRYDTGLWDLAHLPHVPGYDDIADLLVSPEAQFFALAVSLCNAIVQEHQCGPVFRFEDLVSGSAALTALVEHISAGRFTLDAEVQARIAWIGRINPHASARAGGRSGPAPWTSWQEEVFERLLLPEARALYRELGYALDVPKASVMTSEAAAREAPATDQPYRVLPASAPASDIAVICVPAESARVGSFVDIVVAAEGLDRPASAIQVAVNEANDGSLAGDWTIIGAALGSGRTISGRVQWDTEGWTPGEHRIAINVMFADGGILPWQQLPTRTYTLVESQAAQSGGRRPQLRRWSCDPPNIGVVGDIVEVSVEAASPTGAACAVQLVVNTAADGSAEGDWITVGTNAVEGPAAITSFDWDTTGVGPGRYLLGFNIVSSDGATLWWYQQPPRHYHLREAPPVPASLSATGTSPDAPATSRDRLEVRPDPPDAAPVGRAVSLTVVAPADTPELEYIQLAFGAKASTANDKWKLLPPGSADLAGRSARFRWDTTGLASGRYELVVNLGLRDGTVRWWNEHGYVYSYRLT